jgi:hypothetical protein
MLMMRMASVKPGRERPELPDVVAANGLAAEALDVRLPCNPGPTATFVERTEPCVIGLQPEDSTALTVECVRTGWIKVLFAHDLPRLLREA